MKQEVIKHIRCWDWGGTFAVLLLTCILCHEQILVTLIEGKWFFGDRYDSQIRYPYLLEQFANQFNAGVWYPRWMYHMYGGYGYPTFLLYPPGYWFFSLPFTYLTDGYDKAVTLSNVVCVLLAFTAYYKIARLFGNRMWVAAGLVALVALDLVWTNSAAYNNIGLSLRFAYCFALWGVYFLLVFCRYLTAGKEALYYGVGWVVASVAVFYSHPHPSFLYVILNGLIVLGILWDKCSRGQRRRLLLAVTIGGGMAVILSAPYWLTLQMLGSDVNLNAAFRGTNTPAGLLALKKDIFGRLKSDHGYHWPSEIIFYIVMLASMFYVRSVVWLRPMLLVYPLLLFMLTPASAFIWKLPLLRSMMSLLRFHPLILTIEFLVIANAVARLGVMRSLSWAVPFFVLSAALLQLVHTDLWRDWSRPLKVNYEVKREKLDKNRFLTFQGWDEFKPHTARIRNRVPNRNRVDVPDYQLVGPEKLDARLVKDTPSGVAIQGRPEPVRITIPPKIDMPVKIRINQLYFPGWKVTLNGDQLPLVPLAHPKPSGQHYVTHDRNGRMKMMLNKAGTYSIDAYYEGPPYWGQRNIIILLLILAMAPMFRKLCRPKLQ